MNRFIKSLLRLVVAGTLAVGCAAQSQSSDRSATQPARDRLQIAEQMFQAHCKTAGEKIYKTVDNVQGILLMKVRPEGINYNDQFAMDDPYGRDLGGDGYIESFVRGSYGVGQSLALKPGWPQRRGYAYVDAVDQKDVVLYRYTGHIEEPWQTNKHYLRGYVRFVLDRRPSPGPRPRYGVTYDDISTHEDREYWIAGSSLKVVDLQTNKVIAERIGYMMDRGQGNTSGGRSPWLSAADHACPGFDRHPGSTVRVPAFSTQPRQAQDFVEKVLKPASEER